jgi:hypothetical protein
MANTTNTIKKIADNTVGLLNRAEQYLLQNLDPANKNLFQFILYPKLLDDTSLALSVGGSLAQGIKDLAFDTLIAQIYIRSLDLAFISIQYERMNEIQTPRKIEFPDTITLQILEDESGLVGNYLYKWMNSIIFPVFERDGQSPLTRVNYVWKDNQEAAKKNATLVPQSGIGLPALRFIRLYGLKLQTIDNITYGHGEGDPLIYSVTCSVDSVWFKPLF